MTQPGQEAVGEFQVQTVWPADLAAQAQVVNQCLFAWDEANRDVVYMLFGHVAPPLFLTPETAHQYLEQNGAQIPIQPRGSFIVSRSRAEEIWEALGRHLGKNVVEQG
ncbi:hypothetical protein CH304_16225 [Rhodococcus sp. 15-649-1-2]|nr:hypothetical protein CH304_16225 [Rhodococcus sp. 15-649-1-2]